jgi:hypothetical protein
VFAAGALGLLVALAAGCDKNPADVPGGDRPDPQAGRRVVALEPRDMAQEVSRRPVFRWRLPAALVHPDMVSMTLTEVGPGDEPRRNGTDEKPVAFASGLHGSSPTGVDPFAPPADSVVTGEVHDLRQLKAQTWYHWTVRAIGMDTAASGDFYFRTRSEDAVPTAPPK